MDLLGMLMSAGGDAAVQQLGSRFGLDESQTGAALRQLVPALGNGLQRNVAAEGGADSLLGALSSGNHGRYVEDPSLLQGEDVTAEGNGILGHLLGGKDASRQVAAEASAQTGIGADVLKQMLPVVATLVMGSLAKNNAAQPEGFLGMLTPMLDRNKDGAVADDVLDMVGRFMRNR